jgi:hypothetical protein
MDTLHQPKIRCSIADGATSCPQVILAMDSIDTSLDKKLQTQELKV